MTRDHHVRRIVDTIDVGLLEELRRDPAAALERVGLQVRPVTNLSSQRGAGGLCDGVSFSKQNTILYAPTESRREHFTLLHEYAHLLVAKDTAVLNWLADLDDPAAEIEQLCNAIAAAVLVPDEVLDRVIGSGPVTGQHLLDLFYEVPAASQIVCAIALARRLGCTGAILLTDRATQKVVYAARVGDPDIYPLTDQQLPEGHPLRVMHSGGSIRRKSFWATPWGARRDYYLDAAASTKRTYSVLADIDLWGIERLHLTTVTTANAARPSADISCRCGFSGTAIGWPCPACDQAYCPRCKDCDCARRVASSGTCKSCFLSVPPIDLTNGFCSGCR